MPCTHVFSPSVVIERALLIILNSESTHSFIWWYTIPLKLSYLTSNLMEWFTPLNCFISCLPIKRELAHNRHFTLLVNSLNTTQPRAPLVMLFVNGEDTQTVSGKVVTDVDSKTLKNMPWRLVIVVHVRSRNKWPCTGGDLNLYLI